MRRSKIPEIEQRIGEDLGNYLRREYEQNNRATKGIAESLNIGESTIRSWLKKCEIPLRDASQAKLQKGVVKPSKEELENMYVRQNRTPKDIGSQYNVNISVIRNWLSGYEIPIRDMSEAKLPKDFIKPTKEDLEKMYVQDYRTPKDIGDQLGVSNIKIKSLLIKYEIPLRDVSQAKLPKDFVNPSKEELEKLYLIEHKSPYEIGKQFNVSKSMAVSLLKEKKIPIRNNSEARFQKGVVKPSKEELENMYTLQHRSLEEIGRDLRVSHNTIRSWLSEYEILIRSVSDALLPNDFVKPSKDELEKMYVQDHRSPSNIGDQLGVGNTTIKRWLIKFGIPIRSSSETLLPKDFVNTSKDELEKMYVQDHRTPKDIGVQVGVSNVKIINLLKEYEIPIRDASESNLPIGVVKPSKEELERMYVKEQRSANNIGKHVGVSSGTVGKWLIKYEIEKESKSKREELESLLEKYVSGGV